MIKQKKNKDYLKEFNNMHGQYKNFVHHQTIITIGSLKIFEFNRNYFSKIHYYE